MRFALSAALFTLAVLLTACAGSSDRGDAEAKAELTEFTATASVKEMWFAEAGQGGKWYALAPWFEGNAIYVADAEGHISAWHPESGKRLWRVDLDAPISGGVGGGNGLLLVGTKKGQVVALRADNGTELWRVAVTSEILAQPVASKGVAVVQTGDGKIFGIAASDGKRLWVQERTEPSLTLRGTSAPTVVNHRVLCGFSNGRLAAFDLNDGRQLWELLVAEPRGRNEIERLVDVDTQPIVSGTTVYSGAYQGRLIAANVDTGAILWSRELSVYADMDRDNNSLYVTDAKGVVIALDSSTGGILWKQENLRGRGLTGPAVVNNRIVVGDSEGYLHFLQKDNGAFAARYKFSEEPTYEEAQFKIIEPGDSSIRSKPLVVGETVYVLNGAGRLAALRIR